MAEAKKNGKKRALVGLGILGAIAGLMAILWPGKAKASPAAREAPAEPGPNPAEPYVVQAGDTLVSLAERFYGGSNARHFMFAIYDRNKFGAGLDNPNLIRVGVTLKIPTREAVLGISPAALASYKARWAAYLRVGRYTLAQGNPGDVDRSIVTTTFLGGFGGGQLARVDTLSDPQAIADAFAFYGDVR